ncbi:hypothetical protein KQX54_000058, partial [Cotesia glomerata]
MTSWWVLSFRSIADAASIVKTQAACKHSYHDSCVKVRFGLPSKTYAAGKIAAACPVCIPDVSEFLTVLASINMRLDGINTVGEKVDALTVKVDGVDRLVIAMGQKVDKLSLDYNALKVTVKKLEDRVAAVEKDRRGMSADILEEVKRAAHSVNDGGLELRTLQLESQLLADEIMIGGLPEDRDEKLIDVVLSLSDTLGVPVADVVKVERLGRAGGKNRNIRVKFLGQRFVDNVMRSVKRNPVKLGTLKPAAQVPDAPVW